MIEGCLFKALILTVRCADKMTSSIREMNAILDLTVPLRMTLSCYPKHVMSREEPRGERDDVEILTRRRGGR